MSFSHPNTAAFRQAGAAQLAAGLQASRRDTLDTFAVYAEALRASGMAVAYSAELNPPLWELGHIGWFQEFWLARNPERERGAAADPDALRSPAQRPGADRLYDSSRVAHESRWSLALPDAAATLSDLRAQLQATLELLRHCAESDAALYFFRLVLAHEDMHHEAALYMAQALGLPVADSRWQPAPIPAARNTAVLASGRFEIGHTGAGFAFDNERVAHMLALPESRIDLRVLRWDEFLPFVEAGGYEHERWWSRAGWAWRCGTQAQAPRYLRRDGARWSQQRYGLWQALGLSEPACHLNLHEAEAWCAWAGRRLPSEAEWERAAIERADELRWGDVWEWTASDFEAYPGFVAHPYRDYSQPWFGSRRVLRGASFATQPRLRHARYRNYFEPARNDIFAGFRTCEV